MFWTRLRGCKGIFANLNYVVLFLVKQARCLQHTSQMYEEIFKGTLAEVKTSVTAVVCGRSCPKIMHRFTWCIDLNVTWQKLTPEVKRIWVLWIKCSVYTLPTGLLTCSAHDAGGWQNPPSASQRAGSREQDGSQQLALSRVQLVPLQPLTLVKGNEPDPSMGSCPSPLLFPRQSFPLHGTFALADCKAGTKSGDIYACARGLCKL